MSGHTPGPWLADGRTIYALTHYGWRKGVEQLANRFSAHVALGHECDSEEAEANARLIAAAPCLLDALKRLNSATRRYMEERPESDAEWASDEPSVLSIVDAAIAKATGGES